jgi:hypothetical protein
MVPPNNDPEKEKELLENARNALLQHYSSKSSNESQIILGLSVAFFAVITTYSIYINKLDFQPLFIINVFFIIVLAIIIVFVIYAIARLIYWGKMASALMRLKAFEGSTVNKIIKDQTQELTKEQKQSMTTI